MLQDCLLAHAPIPRLLYTGTAHQLACPRSCDFSGVIWHRYQYCPGTCDCIASQPSYSSSWNVSASTTAPSCRWQRRPAGNWCRGFSDHATMKLIEMNGEAQGATMASLHLRCSTDHGRVATLYIPAAATAQPQWQDLIVLVGLVAMQQELIQRRLNAAAGSASASSSASGAAVAASC